MSPRTLVALAVRDRAALVHACLESVDWSHYFTPVGDRWTVAVWLDPLDTETGADWLARRGVDAVVTVGLEPSLSGSARVFALRSSAAKFARANGFDRVLFLDSDVVLSTSFVDEFERLWPHVERERCGALSLGNYGGYDKHVVQGLPELGATVRRFGLGACLAFPAARLEGIPEGNAAAWDTYFSRVAAGHRVLTSDSSYVRHDGAQSGLCAARGVRGLQFQRLATDLVQ